MANLYLVRHGQASFGAADYDQLSPTGHLQGERLGAYWHTLGLQFDAVYTGTLRRHQQTLAAISAGHGTDWAANASPLPELDEYDAHALLAATGFTPTPVDSPEAVRQHFAALCKALAQWIEGRIAPQNMPDWPSFHGGLQTVIERVRTRHAGRNVLVVSSGGPISTLVASAVGAPHAAMVGLNMQLRNSALSQLDVGAKRTSLKSFNTLPHLAAAADQVLVTGA